MNEANELPPGTASLLEELESRYLCIYESD